MQRTDPSDAETSVEVTAMLGRGGHSVRIASEGDTAASCVESPDVVGETVGVFDLLAERAEPVSPMHLPPFFRWEAGRWSFTFESSWRTAAPSVVVSLRHLRSLRRHPRALVIEHDQGEHDESVGVPIDGDSSEPPVAALEMAAPTRHDPGRASLTVEWRGWHVVQVDDPFRGTEAQVLATHTRAVCSG